ncbi:ABC transporter, substrate-binding protein, aliphatic sulfonates family [Hartmannibacter diazotrophicus]|uniref:ABC transporter, substrate-binding protein, aliphatic sulfonates family n=1 Tax=Hartmannibacter diazotrophicus TaxID=1482074 RepID=A0A2C9D973_9HYPH|nr:ABC transporter substrate-binding protein [Hartmannibacter diazotrophicus]SON56698.1 ABC transporter, substrate-binding protein, aliphatic sulfonates family [Hartmannibacter diazotrophicus]
MTGFLNRTLIAAAALAAATGIAFAQESKVEQPDVKLSLDWAFQGPQSVYLYGLEKNFYKAHGLNVQVDRGSGSGDTVLRVASGAYDFGWADIASMAKFNLQNPDKQLVAVYMTGANSPLAVVSVKGRGIEEPKDLAGKTLTATASSSALALFDVFAEKAGFDSKSVTWKQVSGQLREPMMVRGESDALAGFTTSSIMTVADLGVAQDDIVVFRYNDYGVKQYGTAIMVRPEFLEKNPETVRAMVAAINDSFKAAIEDPTASVATIKARDSLANPAVECPRLIEGLKNLTLSDEFKKEGLSTVDMDRLAASIDEIKQVYKLDGDLPLDHVYRSDFLPSKEDRMPPELGTCS